MSNVKRILFLLAILLSPALATADPGKQCAKGAWTNAFEPDQTVIPQPTDRCPADLTKPFYSREGTLVCGTAVGLQQAKNVMANNWRYIPLPGGSNPYHLQLDQPVSAENFGCRILSEGTALHMIQKGYGGIHTDLGWVPAENVRN